MNLKSFVERNGAKLLLIIVPLLYTKTGNLYWRLLPVKVDQEVTKFKGSLTFSSLHREWLFNVLSKDIKGNTVCVLKPSTG